MATEESLHEAARLRFRFQMNNRLRLESLAAISKVFRDFGEPIEDELLASMVFAVPEELIGEYSRFADMAARHPLKGLASGTPALPRKRRPSGGTPPKNLRSAGGELRPPGGERIQKRRPPGGTPAKTSRPPTAGRPTGSRPPTADRPTGSRPSKGERPPGGTPAKTSRPPTAGRPTGSRPSKGERPPGGTRPAYEGGRPTTTKRTKVSAKRPPGGKRKAKK